MVFCIDPKAILGEYVGGRNFNVVCGLHGIRFLVHLLKMNIPKPDNFVLDSWTNDDMMIQCNYCEFKICSNIDERRIWEFKQDHWDTYHRVLTKDWKSDWSDQHEGFLTCNKCGWDLEYSKNIRGPIAAFVLGKYQRYHRRVCGWKLF